MLELYKMLYLLKKDQQMISQYYNQLSAYTEVFVEQKYPSPSLEVAELLRVLADMKPIVYDLNIYEDSKLRKRLAFEHIKEEIV